MPLEIERKFLLSSPAWTSLVVDKIAISQGYLCSKPWVRVRIKGDKGFLAIKSDGNAIPGRLEYEYEIPFSEARELLENFCPRTIEKIRNVVIVRGVVWEIDVFYGPNRGLVVAEIELKDPSETFEKPEWIGQEVTNIRFPPT